jgi:hypothetical protein
MKRVDGWIKFKGHYTDEGSNYIEYVHVDFRAILIEIKYEELDEKSQKHLWDEEYCDNGFLLTNKIYIEVLERAFDHHEKTLCKINSLINRKEEVEKPYGLIVKLRG